MQDISITSIEEQIRYILAYLNSRNNQSEKVANTVEYIVDRLGWLKQELEALQKRVSNLEGHGW